MQGNHFQGPVPSSLCSLKGLRVLDLSHNNFQDEIPECFVDLPLEHLNLSYNDFQGKIPIGGIFSNTSLVSVVGNNSLCGGIPEFKLPPCETNISKERHPWRLVIGILSSSVGLIILSLVIYMFWFRKKRKESSSSSSFLVNPLLNLSYHCLFKATERFSSENLIGIGSFGSVYKGKLDEGRTIIAVKVLNLQHQRAIKSFIMECEALRNIRHRNLVKILTVCSSIDNHGNDFKALVYEFMPNGSLENWLHPPAKINQEASPRHLNFTSRLNIIIDIAFVLDYLHHHCGAMVVQCDLKPSNILLDGEMIAHVSDFGLAKFLSPSITSTPITHGSSSLGVRGTVGYAPLEYGMGSEVSACGDVYSFGVVLLEMLMGKRPTDDIFEAGQDLHKYCKEAISEKLIEILDPSLAEELFTERDRSRDDHRVIDGLTLLFTLGISCSVELPKDRPSISDVAQELCDVRNQILLRYTT